MNTEKYLADLNEKYFIELNGKYVESYKRKSKAIEKAAGLEKIYEGAVIRIWHKGICVYENTTD